MILFLGQIDIIFPFPYPSLYASLFIPYPHLPRIMPSLTISSHLFSLLHLSSLTVSHPTLKPFPLLPYSLSTLNPYPISLSSLPILRLPIFLTQSYPSHFFPPFLPILATPNSPYLPLPPSNLHLPSLSLSPLFQDRYPGLQVEGGNFPPPPLRQMIAQTLSALKFILLIVLISGQNPFPYLNMATPEAFNWASENKVYACMMIFFVSNMLETQLISTGKLLIMTYWQ